MCIPLKETLNVLLAIVMLYVVVVKWLRAAGLHVYYLYSRVDRREGILLVCMHACIAALIYATRRVSSAQLYIAVRYKEATKRN